MHRRDRELISITNPEGHRWVENIKMNPKIVVGVDVNWIHLVLLWSNGGLL
jgi:hypothetical protein